MWHSQTTQSQARWRVQCGCGGAKATPPSSALNRRKRLQTAPSHSSGNGHLGAAFGLERTATPRVSRDYLARGQELPGLSDPFQQALRTLGGVRVPAAWAPRVGWGRAGLGGAELAGCQGRGGTAGSQLRGRLPRTVGSLQLARRLLLSAPGRLFPAEEVGGPRAPARGWPPAFLSSWR